MSKHTPGPWRLKWDFNVYGDDRNHPGSERIVAGAGGHSNNRFANEVDAENRANARLIAAAPELLEALKLEHGDHRYDPSSRCVACEAIAKAESE